jgi:hypothetical protein
MVAHPVGILYEQVLVWFISVLAMSGGRPGTPAWRRAFDSAERKIGEPLERAAGTETYVDVMLTGLRLQRAIGTALGRVAGGAVSKVLHVAGLPTRGDVRSINRQLTTLTGELRALKAAVADTERPSPGSTAGGAADDAA